MVNDFNMGQARVRTGMKKTITCTMTFISAVFKQLGTENDGDCRGKAGDYERSQPQQLQLIGRN